MARPEEGIERRDDRLKLAWSGLRVGRQPAAAYDESMKLDYTVQIWEEGSQFIAHAMPLDVASSGPSPEAARRAVDEAVQLFLTTAAEQGTLAEVLEDAGYRRERREWRSPTWLSIEQRTCLAKV